ncbi:MAG: putative bifunctional diguanylate cyclase/phosphodiesterase [Mycobacteriales bacterium]
MAGLTVLSGAWSFVTSGPRGVPLVICPTLCFGFAILLSWGLAPAMIAQAAAVGVVAWRLRNSARQAATVAGQYLVSFGVAYLVLRVGKPDPLSETGPIDGVTDVLAVVGAAGAWLLTYSGLALLAARLDPAGPPWRRVRASLGVQNLYKGSLLLLSPILAASAHVTVAFTPLIFVPLYAVQRMARLSGERERAIRLDPLTGLANRTGLRAHFDEMTQGRPDDPGSGDGPLALLLLDLDRFKYVNDTLGHEVGDRLLAEVAGRLRTVAPNASLVARLGGDEFAVLADGVADAHDARWLGAAIAEVLAEPVELDDLHLDVTASSGIALWPEHGRDFATLMRRADVSMYEAKRRGDTCAVYQRERDHHSRHQLQLLTDLRRALGTPERGEISLHYQPQMVMATGEVAAMEALLRWQHPRRGGVPPQDVLQVAEHTTAMHLITTRVIDDVVGQVADWVAAGIELRASLNVSARDLFNGEIVQYLASRLARHGVSPARIQVEVTESALMADPGRATATLRRIADLGVAVALDDFGTGYSSLRHLRELPIAEIKIDRSFVAGMAEHQGDAAIVASTIDMAHALGMRAVAEGCEDAHTWRLLAVSGCDLVQGWHTGRPMPAADVPTWLTGKTWPPSDQSSTVSPAVNTRMSAPDRSASSASQDPTMPMPISETYASWME